MNYFIIVQVITRVSRFSWACLWVGLVLAFDIAPTMSAFAQSYPTRPVRIVVPYPAGGATDYYARILGQKLQEALGQTFIVDNRVGATGIIGYDHVTKSAPDGYTLALGVGALTVMPSLYSKLPFDVLRDFAPISVMLFSQNALVIHPSVPARNVQELIALARAQPGKLNYASSGIGATPHLSMELFKTMAKVNITHIPYKGDAPALADVMAGHVDMYCSTIAGGMITQIKAGKVRAIAVTGKKRALALPEIPTMEEAGLPGYEIVSWYGLLAPARTPQEIVSRLNAAMVNIVSTPDMQEKIIASGSDPATNTPEQFEALMRENMHRFGEIVKAAGAHIN